MFFFFPFPPLDLTSCAGSPTHGFAATPITQTEFVDFLTDEDRTAIAPSAGRQLQTPESKPLGMKKPVLYAPCKFSFVV